MAVEGLMNCVSPCSDPRCCPTKTPLASSDLTCHPLRQKAPPTDVKSDKSVTAPTCLKDLHNRFFGFLSHSRTVSLVSPVSESSPNETDSELSTKTVRRKSRVCRLRVRVRERDCLNGSKSLRSRRHVNCY